MATQSAPHIHGLHAVPENVPLKRSDMCNNSTFNPLIGNDHYVEAFDQLMITDIRHMQATKKHGCQYINQQISRGIKFLSANDQLVIKPADKGGRIVLERKDYITEMNNLLSDSDTYKLLNSGPTAEYTLELVELVK